jgi:superfamily II DNA/RNA helicase
MRAALVDYFREKASILIATEAAAEGINLQFCSMVVNYDLPWNPQRIEQRIGAVTGMVNATMLSW